MGTPAVEKGLRPVETENRHTYLSFTEALKRIRPETEGTPVPELVSGLICSFGEIVYQRDNGERVVLITESGAQILYNPQEKARRLPAQIKRISDCCRGRETEVNGDILNILNGLAEGPDLDLKLPLREGVGFSSVETVTADYLKGLTGVSLEEEGSCYRLAEGMTIEVKKLFIPIYDFDPKMERAFSRPLLEFRFRKRDGSLILKVHLTTTPFNSAFNYAADCRLGWSSSLKNTICRAEVILPDKPAVQQKPVVRLGNLVAYFLSGGDNLSMYRFIRVGEDCQDILNILPCIPIRATIGVLRLIETAFLTMSDNQITQGKYWEKLSGGLSLYDISAVFDQIVRDERLYLRPIPPSAKQEILNLWLRTLLINDPKLVLETAFDLGMLDLFKANREDFQDIVALTDRLKKPQPEKIIADLNHFRELFSL